MYEISRRQKCDNKRLSFLKAEKEGKEGSEKQTDDAAVEDEDLDSESKEATVLSKVSIVICLIVYYIVQPADIGWPTGNGKKLRCSQAQLSQATCLTVA